MVREKEAKALARVLNGCAGTWKVAQWGEGDAWACMLWDGSTPLAAIHDGRPMAGALVTTSLLGPLDEFEITFTIVPGGIHRDRIIDAMNQTLLHLAQEHVRHAPPWIKRWRTG
jgi:hypothetical protein